MTLPPILPKRKIINSFLKRVYASLNQKPEKFFLLVASIAGVGFLVVIPPLQTPDEDLHFMRAYKISDLKFASERQGDKIGDTLPLAIEETSKVLHGSNNMNVKFNSNVKYNLRQVKHALTLKNNDQKKFYEAPASSGFSPIGYIPQAIGVSVGRLFNSPVVLQIYLARLFNLFAWLAFGYFAIKLMPFKKWAIVGIALIPMMVAQSISTGADVVSIGAGVLFMATILSTLEKIYISKKQIAVIILSAIAMVASKPIMALFLPLVALIAFKKNQPRKKLFIAIGLTVILPFTVFALLSMIAGQTGSSSALVTNGEIPRDQISYLVHQPWQFIIVLFNTFFFTWGDGVVQSLIGNFGWVDTPLAASFIVAGYILLAFMLFVNYEKVKPFVTKNMRTLFLLVAIVYVFAVCGAMYVYFSPVKYGILVGVQGRYMIPAIFLFVAALYGRFLITNKKNYIRVVKYGTSLLLTVSLVTIIFRYYITYI